MIIGSISENTNLEKRVAVTPDVVKKYISLGLKVHLSKNYASHIGINDNEYQLEGAKIFSNSNEVITSSDAIIQLNYSSNYSILLTVFSIDSSVITSCIFLIVYGTSCTNNTRYEYS